MAVTVTSEDCRRTIAEMHAEFECQREAGEIQYGGRDGGHYTVRPLTAGEVDEAAGKIATLAAIPELRDGVVGFRWGLEGGRWYRDRGTALDHGETLAVEIPGENVKACRRALVSAMREDRRSMRALIAKCREGEDRRGYELEIRAWEIAA
jgi:hypothetical protein